MRCLNSIALVLAGCLAAAPPVQAQPAPATGVAAGDQVLDLPLAGGVHERVLYQAPLQSRGTLVMLPGGAGDVGIRRDGEPRHNNNFVVRTRALWAARGYAVLIPDTLSGANLRGLRSSPDYAGIVEALVAKAHGLGPGPVFLLGTSQGSIAATNAAAHARPGEVAGVVLTESVSRMGGSGETVFDAHPAAVRVPALVVANRNDRCDVAPPGDAPRIAAALVNSPDVQVLMVSGGTNGSDRACGSLSPHGYNGIEPEVVDGIARWLDSHG